VSPEPDIEMCYLSDDVPDAVSAFYRVNDVAHFRLDRPFYSGDKSDGDVKVLPTCSVTTRVLCGRNRPAPCRHAKFHLGPGCSFVCQ